MLVLLISKYFLFVFQTSSFLLLSKHTSSSSFASCIADAPEILVFHFHSALSSAVASFASTICPSFASLTPVQITQPFSHQSCAKIILEHFGVCNGHLVIKG